MLTTFRFKQNPARLITGFLIERRKMNIHEELAKLQKAEIKAQHDLDIAHKNLRAFINNNDLNKKEPVWPSDNRINNIAQNGNTGEHYD